MKKLKGRLEDITLQVQAKATEQTKLEREVDELGQPVANVSTRVRSMVGASAFIAHTVILQAEVKNQELESVVAQSKQVRMELRACENFIKVCFLQETTCF